MNAILHRVNTAAHFLTPATASRTGGVEAFFRRDFASGSFSVKRRYCRRVMDPVSSAMIGGGDDFVHVDEGDQIPDGDSGGESEGYEHSRRIRLQELSRNTVRLTCESLAEGGLCEVYVVGTAHVSSDSCKEVQAVIDFLKPQVVFLELCSSRLAVLKPHDLKVPSFGQIIEMWKKNQNPLGILYGWLLYKVGTKLEVLPGSEFRIAYEEAMKYGGKVILGDRPVHITMRRTWAKMSIWHKTKLLYSLLFQAVFLPSPEDLTKALKEMDDVDMLTLVIQEMSKKFPTLMETLVHERDQYMSAKLLAVACQCNSVVAVVGKGHLTGIQKNWKQPVEIKELLTIPSKDGKVSAKRILAAVGVAALGVAVISGLYISSKK